MKCFSNTLLLFSMFQHLYVMDWAHIRIQKFKIEGCPNGVIIGQIQHLSPNAGCFKNSCDGTYTKRNQSRCVVINTI